MQKDWYYKIADDESNDDRWYTARKDIVLWLIEKLFNRKKDISLLDVWSGTWYLLEKLSHSWYKNIWWLDYSEDSINICKKKWIHIEYWLLPNIDLRKKYDCITCLDVIEHIDEDKLSIENVLKKLEKGGKAIFTVPAYKFLRWHHDVTAYHKRRYTLKWFKNVIENVWWEIEYISYYNFFLFPIALLFKYINKKNNNMNSRLSGFINKLFYKIFRSEFRFIRRKIVLPFGLSIIAVVNKK